MVYKLSVEIKSHVCIVGIMVFTITYKLVEVCYFVTSCKNSYIVRVNV